MTSYNKSNLKCKKCGKFVSELPCHTNLYIDCYFNPKTTIKEKYKDDFIEMIGVENLD